MVVLFLFRMREYGIEIYLFDLIMKIIKFFILHCSFLIILSCIGDRNAPFNLVECDNGNINGKTEKTCKAEQQTQNLFGFILGLTGTTIAQVEPTVTTSQSQVETPTFNTEAGTYNSDQSVTISTATEEATIYYTTDGTEPTGSSIQFTDAISIAGNGTSMTIKAIAVKSGMENSSVASGTWTISYENLNVASISPGNNAVNVSPELGIITIQFNKPMNTNIKPTKIITEWEDASGIYMNIPNSGSSFEWVNSKTLQVNISWILFPENTKLRWTLETEGIETSIGDKLTESIQNVFTTTALDKYIPLIKTGQTKCYDSSGTEINCSETGQDGEYQNGLSRNYSGPTAHSNYTEDYTTTDNNTSLVWKTCTEGLSVFDCSQGTKLTFIWEQAINGCAYLNLLNNNEGYAGKKNWRLPTRKELQSLFYFGNDSVSINEINYNGIYWSLSSKKNIFTGNNIINSDTSGIYSRLSDREFNILCVSGKIKEDNKYLDNSDGTILDLNRNLQWQKCSWGQNHFDNCTGTAEETTWQEAINICNNLVLADKNDWHLPNNNELESLVNIRYNNPSINSNFFPNTLSNNSKYYWTSTSYKFTESTRLISFVSGGTAEYGGATTTSGGIISPNKNDTFFIRCVRSQ